MKGSECAIMCIVFSISPQSVLSSLCTLSAWSDTVATIYFIMQFCAASIQEWHLLNSGRKMKKSIASRKCIILCFLQSLNCNSCRLSACFDIAIESWDLFTSVCATWILATASIWEGRLHVFCSAHIQRCCNNSRAATNRDWHLIKQIQYVAAVVNQLKHCLRSCTMGTVVQGRSLEANTYVALGFASCSISLSTAPLCSIPHCPLAAVL